ncbi:uncharacterized protein LOC109597079 [Aethina tumida]|uniref:uncharacterized protein LOC109597079 n=1 Tax=Aethina tumida TaxID=116153 RepID=UPI00096AE181|nr:uncharacterized protein LOC109597079 [Aethina tumida]
MYKLGKERNLIILVLHCSVIILLCLHIESVNSHINHRVRRKVVFTKSSKFFFRLNGKDTVLNRSDIFAHGWAVRVNYDLPSTIPRRHQLFKRDIYSEMTSLPIESASEGFHCIFRHLCEMFTTVTNSQTSGFLSQIGGIITQSQGMEADFFKSFVEKCDYQTDTCPSLSEGLIIDSSD